MQVVLHFPKPSEEKKELSRRVARIQADAMVNYINGLPYEKAKKQELLDSVIEEVKKHS